MLQPQMLRATTGRLYQQSQPVTQPAFQLPHSLQRAIAMQLNLQMTQAGLLFCFATPMLKLHGWIM